MSNDHQTFKDAYKAQKRLTFIGEMISELVDNGITVQLFNKNSIEVESGGTISGGFDDEGKTLEVCTDTDIDWMLTLTHEYCHFKQWKEGMFDDVVQIAAFSVFDPWLSGDRTLTPKLLKKFIRAIQYCEQDCEKRTIEILKNRGIDFDEEDYIRKANVYILSYEMTRRIRKWAEEPMISKDLMDLVPGDRIINVYEFGELPEGFEAIAIKSYGSFEYEVE